MEIITHGITFFVSACVLEPGTEQQFEWLNPSGCHELAVADNWGPHAVDEFTPAVSSGRPNFSTVHNLLYTFLTSRLGERLQWCWLPYLD